MIGGIIMTHGDNSGLVLPPKIAPVQIVIIPIAMHKEGVLEKARAVAETLRAAGLRVKLDESEQSPGWKFAEYEMKGVPLRLERGPKDIEQNQCVLVRRDNGEKSFVSLDSLVESANTLMDAVHDGRSSSRRSRKWICVRELSTRPGAFFISKSEKEESQCPKPKPRQQLPPLHRIPRSPWSTPCASIP